MANYATGMFFTNLAMRALPTLRTALFPVTAFSTNYGEDIPQGNSVDVTLIPTATASDLNDDHSGSYHAAVSDVETNKVNVTLSQHPISAFGLTDVQKMQIADGKWTDTAASSLDEAIYAVAKEVLDFMQAYFTIANYTAAKIVGNAAAFTKSQVAQITTDRVKAGWTRNSPTNRMLLSPDYYGSLGEDTELLDKSASQSDILNTTIVPRVGGFGVVEAPTMPKAGTTPAAENLVGVASRPDALAIAIVPVTTQAPEQFSAFSIVQDEVSGVGLTIAEAWNDDKRRKEITVETRIGAVVANVQSLMRLTNV